jgi:hypothetical protein
MRPFPPGAVAPAVLTLAITVAASTTTASIACLIVAPSFVAVVAILCRGNAGAVIRR